MYGYKYVVFDLDETLGYFTELGIFWDSLKSVLKNLNQNEFNKFVIYIKNFRPGIFSIITFLLKRAVFK